MHYSPIVQAIDQDIDFHKKQLTQLQSARSLLVEKASGTGEIVQKRRGRPPLSPEARERISAAQRKRWAKKSK